MECSMPGFPVLHYLLQFAQIHVHWFGDAIQLSPLMVDLSFIWYPCTEISLRALRWWAHCCDQNQQLSKLWQGPSTGNRAFGQHTNTHTHTRDRGPSQASSFGCGLQPSPFCWPQINIPSSFASWAAAGLFMPDQHSPDLSRVSG